MRHIGFVRQPEFQPQVFVLRFKSECKTIVKYAGGGFMGAVRVYNGKLPKEGFPEQIVLLLQPCQGTKWKAYSC